MPYDALDDAAQAALWPIRHAPREHIGALYAMDGRIASTPTVTANDAKSVGGTLKVPRGTLRALYHDHPIGEAMKGDLRRDIEGERQKFSRDDIAQARGLGVPSYISAGERIFRYDPSGRTEEVLAQLPLDPIKQLYIKGLMK